MNNLHSYGSGLILLIPGKCFCLYCSDVLLGGSDKTGKVVSLYNWSNNVVVSFDFYFIL